MSLIDNKKWVFSKFTFFAFFFSDFNAFVFARKPFFITYKLSSVVNCDKG